jgi:hypothetical protein
MPGETSMMLRAMRNASTKGVSKQDQNRYTLPSVQTRMKHGYLFWRKHMPKSTEIITLSKEATVARLLKI